MFNTLTSWLRPSTRQSRDRGKPFLQPLEYLEDRVVPDSTPWLLSGGPLAQNWTNTGLITADNVWSGVPSIQGFSGAGLLSSDNVDPQTVLADETTLRVDANETNPSTLLSDGVAEFHITNPTVALAGASAQPAPFLVFYLNTTGMQTIQVQYNLRDLTSTDATTNQFALQYRIGNSGDFINVPAGYVADATGAGATTVTAVSVSLPAAANNQSEVQVRVITTRASGLDEWVGVDDINISATPFIPNQAPTISLPGGSLNYIENDPATILDPGATLTDVDSPDFDTGSLAVDLTANGTADDRLEIRNEGTAAGQIGVSGSIVTFGGTTIGTFTGGVGTTPLIVTFNSTAASVAAVQALIRNIAFSNISDTPSTAPRTARFVVSDGDGGTSSPVTKTITVTDTNEVPALNGTNNLAGLDEDPPANPGTLVSDLIAGQITDPDGPGSGIAVSAVDDVSGRWEYAINGTAFSAITLQLSNGNVLLLAADADTRVRFVPDTDFHGTVAGLTFRAWDRSDGYSEGASIDPSAHISSTGSLSLTTATASIDVASVLDTPVVTGATTSEDTQTSSGLVVSRHLGDGPEVSHFKITGITGGLLFKNDGSTPVLDGDFVSFADANAGLKFTPAPDLNSLSTLFGFNVQSSSSASDAGLGGGLATATITVNPVNDAPVLGAIGGSVLYLIGEAPLIIDGDGTATDIDSPDFDGGAIVVGLAAGGQSGDVLGIQNQGAGTGQIGLTGSSVTYEGTVIGTFGGGTGGSPLVVSFNASATPEAVQALARSVTFFSSSPGAVSGGRTVELVVTDGDGGTSSPATVTVNVIAEMSVVSIVRVSGSPSAATTMSWTVTFSLPVMGVTAGNFALAGSLAAISSIDSVVGSGTNWTAMATAGGSGDGALGLDLMTDAGINLRASNAPFVGEVYEVDRTGPVVAFDDGDADDLVAIGIPLTYSVSFNEDIDGNTVQLADFENAGTAAISFGTIQVTGNRTVEIQVTPTTGGTLQLGLGATATVTDVLGNPVIVPVADDTTVTVDSSLLTITGIDDGDGDNVIAPNETVTFTIDFAEPIDFGSISAIDFVNAGTSTVALGQIAQADADTITVQVTPTTPGTLILQVGPAITDVAGNPMAAAVLDNDVLIVNVPPTAAPDQYFPVEDATLSVSAALGLLANDTDTNDPPTSLIVDTAPVASPLNGTLTLAPDGSFTYTPDPDYFGTDTFVYRVLDPHGGSSTASVTLNVAAVNDEPTITLQSDVVPVGEDAGPQSIPGFATGIAVGPANESGQTIVSLVVSVIGTTGSLAFAASPTISLVTGELTFLTAPDTNGTATVEVALTDTGDGTSPNDNTAVRTFTIVVNAVNDAPTFQMPGVAPTVFEDTGPQSVRGFASGFQPGPVTAVDEIGQSPSFLVTVTGMSAGLSFSVPPAIAPDGTLTYTPAPNASGTAAVSVQARDDGGTAAGGQDRSPPRTFTIFVTPVNDPPSAVDDTVAILSGSGPTTIDVLANDSTAPDLGESLVGVTSVTQPSHGQATLAGGTVRYEPEDGFVGTDRFQYTIRDSNGGTATATVNLTVAAIRPHSETPGLIAVGSGPGGGSQVRLYSLPTGSLVAEFSVFGPSFTGGVNVSVGDVNGDDVPDLVVSPGLGGGPHVKVIDGNKFGMVDAGGGISNSALLGSFFAYSPGFLGGVMLSVGDVNGDGLADIVTGTGSGGGAHVKVFDGASIGSAGAQLGPPAVLASFLAYAPSFLGGVNVAAGDFNGDGVTDIVTAPGAGGGSHVKVFDGTLLGEAGPGDGSLLGSFFAYGADFVGGVNLAAGDVDGDGRADIITGAGPGGGSHVKIFSGESSFPFASFFAFPGSVGSGVDVTFRAPEGSVGTVVAGAGQGTLPVVRLFTGPEQTPSVDFLAFDPAFLGGVDVG